MDENAAREGESLHDLVASVSYDYGIVIPEFAQFANLNSQADSAIKTSVAEASRLLSASDPLVSHGARTPRKTQTRNASKANDLIASLSIFASLRAQVVRHTEDEMETITQAEAALPVPEELMFEAERLDEAFEGGALREAAWEAAYREELLRICHSLEAGSTPASSAQLDVNKGSRVLDVRDELMRAWGRDQAAILVAREQVLNRVSIIGVAWVWFLYILSRQNLRSETYCYLPSLRSMIIFPLKMRRFRRHVPLF